MKGTQTPTIVRIHEIEIPLPTLDIEVLKANCQVPIYQPGIVKLGDKAAAVTTATGNPGQVVAGFSVGLNGGQALIIRETAGALDDLRGQIDVLRKGLRVALQVAEELATHARIGQDGRTSTRLREIAESISALRASYFPDEEDPVAQA